MCTVRERSPIAAATLVCEVGDPTRVSRESRVRVLARNGRGRAFVWRRRPSADPAPPRLRRQQAHQQRALHRERHPQRDHQPTDAYIERKITEGKTRREARRATNATSPTASSAACEEPRNDADQQTLNTPRDKGASDSPRSSPSRSSGPLVRTVARARPVTPHICRYGKRDVHKNTTVRSRV